jgi:adenylylsulfate kinase-like enzyme
MTDAGLIVLVSLISPFRAERELARSIVEHDQFIEVYVDTPLAVCEARDSKGLYRRARAGEIRNFTGIDSAYEPPLEPELVLTSDAVPAAELAERVVRMLRRRRIVD